MIGSLVVQPWHLIALAPFVGAGLALLIPSRRLSWVAALLVLIGVASLAVVQSFAGDAPLGGDGVSAFSASLLAVLGASCLFAWGGALKDFQRNAAPYAMALACCAAGGWIYALLASDWIGFALGVEAAWLAAVALAALAGAHRGALNGALRMVVHGGVSAALMFIGVGFVARSSGSLAVAAVVNAGDAALCITGLALVLASLGIKAGLAPLHAWAGAAFGRGGAASALMLASVTITGALAAIVRVGAVAGTAPQLAAGVAASLAALGAASIVIGSIQAMGADNLRRLGAYAFASQAGCVLLSVSLGSPAGFAAALVQMFALAAAMLALFGAAAVTGDAALPALDGMGRRYPIAGVAVTAAALSLMGAPLTIGFLGRWRLIEAAVGAGWWWVAGIALLSSLAAVFYGGRLIERVYFRRAATVGAADKTLWRALLASALVAAILAIGLGVEPSALLHLTTRAASQMFGAAP